MTPHRISPLDTRAMAQVEGLLKKEGLTLDRHLDYTAGLFDEQGQLLATGSFAGNTLRCLAVDSSRQGEGLMATLVSHLTQELFTRGQTHLFIYTKRSAMDSLLPLGFYPIVETPLVVFLENRRNGFANYLKGLTRPKTPPKKVGAVVMNANPFSLGHQYLVEQARGRCDALHLFMVSEDVSVFPRRVREELIRQGTAHLSEVYLHPTEHYLVSGATFPSYFLKETDSLTLAQARLDAQVFGRIAKELGITDRFVGEEPLSPSTALYNQAMSEELPAFGVQLHILQRKSDDGVTPISATRIRALLKEGRIEEIRPLVPQTTYAFLSGPGGDEIAMKLRETKPAK